MKKSIDKSVSSDASELNHLMYKDGCEHFNKSNYSKAKRAFEEAIEYWPEDPEAWMALGNCFNELNKPKKAEGCYRKALQYGKDKNLETYIYNLGCSLFDQENFKEAIECFSSIKPGTDLYMQAKKNLDLAEKELNF